MGCEGVYFLFCVVWSGMECWALKRCVWACVAGICSVLLDLVVFEFGAFDWLVHWALSVDFVECLAGGYGALCLLLAGKFYFVGCVWALL